jgi:hypothetical protein
VTDEGLKYLANLPSLKDLNIINCSITPGSTRYLKMIPQLRALHVSIDSWTPQQVAKFRSEIPKVLLIDI